MLQKRLTSKAVRHSASSAARFASSSVSKFMSSSTAVREAGLEDDMVIQAQTRSVASQSLYMVCVGGAWE